MEMIELISEVRSYGRHHDPNFRVIQQNASTLLVGHPELLTLIGGIAQEGIWYDGIASDNWDSTSGYDVPVDGVNTGGSPPRRATQGRIHPKPLIL